MTETNGRASTPLHVFQREASLLNSHGKALNNSTVLRIAKKVRGGQPWEAPLRAGGSTKRKRGPYGPPRAQKTGTEAPRGQQTVLEAIYGKVPLETFLLVQRGLV